MKSQLCEVVQQVFKEPPLFHTTRCEEDPGPDHAPLWDCEILLPDGRCYEIRSLPGSKTEAENAAALQVHDDFSPEWEMKRDIAGAFYAEFDPTTTKQPDGEVLHTKITGAVVRVKEDCADVRTIRPNGKIRITGAAARGIERGMVVEVLVKTKF